MNEISVKELKQWLDEGKDFQLIDVREPFEYDICNIGGELIPMNTIPDNIDKISRDRVVVLQCRSGSRSGQVLNGLEQNHDFGNLFNLSGGILAWADEIDGSVPMY